MLFVFIHITEIFYIRLSEAIENRGLILLSQMLNNVVVHLGCDWMNRQIVCLHLMTANSLSFSRLGTIVFFNHEKGPYCFTEKSFSVPWSRGLTLVIHQNFVREVKHKVVVEHERVKDVGRPDYNHAKLSLVAQLVIYHYSAYLLDGCLKLFSDKSCPSTGTETLALCWEPLRRCVQTWRLAQSFYGV